MTACQSFVAAAIFLLILFFILFFNIVGRDWLCWIEKNNGLAAWIQAIFSIVAIFGILVQAKLQYKSEIKLRDLDEDKLMFNTVFDISNNCRWLKQKLSESDNLIAIIETSSCDAKDKDVVESLEKSKDLFVLELNQFERRFLKNISTIKNDWELTHLTEVLFGNLARLNLKLKNKDRDLIKEKEVLIGNCEALSKICHYHHIKLHEKLNEK